MSDKIEKKAKASFIYLHCKLKSKETASQIVDNDVYDEVSVANISFNYFLSVSINSKLPMPDPAPVQMTDSIENPQQRVI